jgi:single-stranded-DNA-specific exonuclease
MLTPPTPTIKQRPINPDREKAALAQGLDPLLARIIASRPTLLEETPQDLLSPLLKSLDHPNSLADMDKAVLRLIQALENNEIIGIETDHDCDGQTSHAVIVTALTTILGHPPENIRSYIGHRLKEGYGLSEKVANRILIDDPKPTLVITADNGSSDEAQIARLKEQGIDVIVTDHHEIPVTGIPLSAFAVINPTREDSEYPDKCIAGCMVAWLLMAATRQKIMQLRNIELPSLAQCLDFVAVGTIADCVSMARSKNNRAIVAYGIKLIQKGSRPCWRVLLPILSSPISSEDLGFKIGPLLNSDGRLACAFGSVSFLLAKDDIDAQLWVTHLQEQNAERKTIQERVTQLATKEALLQYQQGKKSLSIFLEEGHAGVHGICASRIKDQFGRPVIIFCPKNDEPTLLTGSARSIDGVHLRQALETVSQRFPGTIERFGGHQGAAGLSILREKFTFFSQAFETVIQEQLHSQEVGPVIWTDGELPLEKANVNYIQSLYSELEPFGREFEPPVFEIQGKILSLKAMGKTQTHARVALVVEDVWVEAVWFGARAIATDEWPVAANDLAKLVISPRIQTFRGQTQLQYQILYCLRN